MLLVVVDTVDVAEVVDVVELVIEVVELEVVVLVPCPKGSSIP